MPVVIANDGPCCGRAPAGRQMQRSSDSDASVIRTARRCFFVETRRRDESDDASANMVIVPRPESSSHVFIVQSDGASRRFVTQGLVCWSGARTGFWRGLRARWFFEGVHGDVLVAHLEDLQSLRAIRRVKHDAVAWS